jgi:hypothetical protein
MTDVKAELKEIRGIGDAKAEAIIGVLEDTQSNETVASLLADALSYYEDDRPGYARKFVERAYNEVN